MNNHKAIDTVIFDMDGVLINSEVPALEKWRSVEQSLHLYGLSTIVWDLCLGVNSERERTILSAYYGTKTASNVIDRLNSTKYQSNPPQLKSGVIELLDWLSTHSYKIGLASSSSIQKIQYNLSTNNILNYFDVVCSGEDLKESKPSPDIYLNAINKLGAQPHSTIVIEDSMNGIISANRAGALAVYIQDTGKFIEGTVNNVIFKCNDLIELKGLFKAKDLFDESNSSN